MGKKKRTGKQTDERKKGPETADVTEEPTNQQPDTENNDMYVQYNRQIVDALYSYVKSRIKTGIIVKFDS